MATEKKQPLSPAEQRKIVEVSKLGFFPYYQPAEPAEKPAEKPAKKAETPKS